MVKVHFRSNSTWWAVQILLPKWKLNWLVSPRRSLSKSTPKIELETPTHFCSHFLRLIKKLFDFFSQSSLRRQNIANLKYKTFCLMHSWLSYVCPWYDVSHSPTLSTWCNIAPWKWAANIGNITNNSAAHRPVALKFDTLVHYGSAEVAKWLYLWAAALRFS